MKTLTKIQFAIVATMISLGAVNANAHGLALTSAGEDLVGIAQQTIEVVNCEKASANYRELGSYILPIRKAAVNLQVMGTMHFPSESVTIRAIRQLERAISNAEIYLNEQLETDTGFELATELMTIREQLRNYTR